MNWHVPERAQIDGEITKQDTDPQSLWAKQNKVEPEIEVSSIEKVLESVPGSTAVEKGLYLASVLGRIAALAMVEDDFWDTIESGLVPPQEALIPEYKGHVQEALRTLAESGNLDALEKAWHIACDTALKPFVTMAGGTMTPSYCPETNTDDASLDVLRTLEEYQWLQKHNLTLDNAKERFMDVRESVPDSSTLLESLHYLIKGFAIQAMLVHRSYSQRAWEAHQKKLTPVIKLVVRKARSLENTKLSAGDLIYADGESIWRRAQAQCEKRILRTLEEYQWLQSHNLTRDNAKERFMDIWESVPDSSTLLESLHYLIKGFTIQAMLDDENSDWEAYVKELTPVIKLVVRKTRSLESTKLSAGDLLSSSESIWYRTQAQY